MMLSVRPTEAEPGAPPPNPVAWVGWARSNPNRVGRATEKLWYDARNAIARELGVVNLGDLEVVQVKGDTWTGFSAEARKA